MTIVAVLDIGKTNAKLALVDAAQGQEIAVLSRPNGVLAGPPYPHYDTQGLWDFFIDGLRQFGQAQKIDAISVTTHGASAVVLDGQGELACPVLDYEHKGPDDLAAEYDALRPDFAETGSARMPMGLNIGAQLHWLLACFPDLAAKTAHVVTYPGYWVYRLTGVLGSDMCSLGCHTDLWNPWANRYSTLIDRLGLQGRMAAPVRPDQVAGTVLPEIAALTGVSPQTPVVFGIHDSNASLVPYLHRATPFSVVSTGTWVISMAMGGQRIELDPTRDILVNVNAMGQPVPSGRFMGGREYEILAAQAKAEAAGDADALLLPSIVQGTGPFPHRSGGWQGQEPQGEARAKAVGHYLAMMTAESLALTGAEGPVLVEGPFARNAHYLAMLATATGREVETSASQTGTAIGAAMLTMTEDHRPKAQMAAKVYQPDPALLPLYQRWKAAIG